MNLLIRLIISTLSILVASYVLPGVYVDSFVTAMIVAIVLGCLNIFIKPFLILFSLPAVIFTLGLFLIVINTFIILITDSLIDGFHVNSFWWALLFSLVMWIVSSALNMIKQEDEKTQE